MADGTSPAVLPSERISFSWRRRLPMVMQSEMSECGLACLTMVALLYGHDIDLASLRRRFGTSAQGTSLAHIARQASQLGLHARPVRLPLEALPKLERGTLLHWDLNHFVVLKAATARRVIVHDPALGERHLTLAEASAHFTGIALLLGPAPSMTPLVDRTPVSVRSVAGVVRGIGTSLGQILLLALALEVFNVLAPFYMQWILDQVLISDDRDLLVVLGLGFVAVALMQAGLTAARSWSLAWLGATINTQWAGNVVTHLLKLPLAWFERRHVGDVVSRLNATQAIQRTLTTQFAGSVLDGIMAVVTAIVMGFYSLPLLAAVVVMFAIYAGIRFAFYAPLRQANERQIIRSALQQSEILESIRGILPIKLAKQETARAGRYINTLVATTNEDVAVQRLTIAFSAASQAVFGVGRVLLLWFAATRVLSGSLSVGMLVAFVSYADQFTTRAGGLIEKVVDLRMLSLQAERLAGITMSAVESEPDVAWQGPELEPSLELRNISFRYAPDDPWVLRDVSLRVGAGESLAITGPSGCGKTTLAKLICGLLQPTEGEILYGGVPISRLGMEQYRAALASVMQDDVLLAGSIADNITFGALDLAPERMLRSAMAAAVHDDIVRMTMGYQTPVGDMGSVLSGGQKQRVLLARALYREPRMIVLDEATSHLDTTREASVNSAIRALRTTRIIIAHRAETIASADRVIALEAPI